MGGLYSWGFFIFWGFIICLNLPCLEKEFFLVSLKPKMPLPSPSSAAHYWIQVLQPIDCYEGSSVCFTEHNNHQTFKSLAMPAAALNRVDVWPGTRCGPVQFRYATGRGWGPICHSTQSLKRGLPFATVSFLQFSIFRTVIFPSPACEIYLEGKNIYMATCI